jgi:hypothetical protein
MGQDKIAHGIELYTLNIKDFSFIDELKIFNSISEG